MYIISQTLVMVIFALIVGGIYFQLDDSPSGLMNRYVPACVCHFPATLMYTVFPIHRLGVIFFIIMSQVFGNLGAIELFIKERAAFL